MCFCWGKRKEKGQRDLGWVRETRSGDSERSTRGSPGGPNQASRPQLQRRPFARRASKSLAKHTANIPPPSGESRCLL